MGLFTRLRIALEQAAAIEAMQKQVAEQQAIVTQLQFEWGDVLDKLLAREERWRKRYKAEVTNALAPTENTTANSSSVEHDRSAMGRGDKGALRSRVTAIRQASQ